MLAVVAGVCLATGSRSHTAVSAPIPPGALKPQPVKWEYGRLQLRAEPGWTCAEEHVLADSDEDLAKKLKAVVPKDANEHMLMVTILDRLGSQGWEMVTHIKQGKYDFYRFKRPLFPKD